MVCAECLMLLAVVLLCREVLCLVVFITVEDVTIYDFVCSFVVFSRRTMMMTHNCRGSKRTSSGMAAKYSEVT